MPGMNLVEVRRSSLLSPFCAARRHESRWPPEYEQGARPVADSSRALPAHTQAKKFVESLPKTLKEGATKDEAEKLQGLFKAIGAEVALD